MSKLIEKIEAFGGAKLALEIGLTRGAVCHVVKGRRQFSEKNAVKVADALGLMPSDVRPDIWKHD